MKIPIKKIEALVGETWAPIFYKLLNTDIAYQLMSGLKEERKNKNIIPPSEIVFRCFKETPLDKVKVVIIGRDPYPKPGHSDGLAFSSSGLLGVPRSLQNVLGEVERSLGFREPSPSPNLTRWASQGVLLMNQILTVEAYKPGSHYDIGWEYITGSVIQHISDHYGKTDGELFMEIEPNRRRSLVFMLWGSDAHKLKMACKPRKHKILTTSHPSPNSVLKGFKGCNHFKYTNDYLLSQKLTPIDW